MSQTFRSDSARVPLGMPLGFSGKFLDVRKTFAQQKTEPLRTRSYDNQLKPK
jgi:hypothetical protein